MESKHLFTRYLEHFGALGSRFPFKNLPKLFSSIVFPFKPSAPPLQRQFLIPTGAGSASVVAGVAKFVLVVPGETALASTGEPTRSPKWGTKTPQDEPKIIVYIYIY